MSATLTMIDLAGDVGLLPWGTHMSGRTRDLLTEYVGDYLNHARPNQILDASGSWRVTRLQQLDFHVGFGLNSSSPDHFFGIGYSFSLDGLFGGSIGSSL